MNEQIFRVLSQLIVDAVWGWLNNGRLGRKRNTSKSSIRMGGRAAVTNNANNQNGHQRQMKDKYARGTNVNAANEQTGFLPGLMVGAVVGGLVGAAAALLFAPQAGDETQAKLREGAAHLKQKADEKIGTLRENIDDVSGKARDKVEDVAQQGESLLYKQAQKMANSNARG